MDDLPKPRILCVDDDPNVVMGLALLLKKSFEVHTASTAEDALRNLLEVDDLAVVISDMRMPKMDGAKFLYQAVLRRPDATRILLTGQADREEGIRAVNEGQIFRYLIKPCSQEVLKEAIDAGVVRHRLHHAERAILKETLIGSIGALMEVLAIANPVAFFRAGQIKRRAMELAARMGTPDFWPLEAAAMLSQLGYAALPPRLLEKYYQGEVLTSDELAKLDAVPDLAEKILEHIPRLEPVIQIIAGLKWSDTRIAALGSGTIGLGTRILGVIIEYDTLAARGMAHDRICDHLCARASRYGPKLVSQLDVSISLAETTEETLVVSLKAATPGMTLEEELRNAAGVLLVPKGYVVTDAFICRLASISPELLNTKVRVRFSKNRVPGTA